MEEPDGRRQRMRVNSENSFSGSEQLLFEARWPSGKAWVCKTLIVGSTPIRRMAKKLIRDLGSRCPAAI
jgi:hypothetical protein